MGGGSGTPVTGVGYGYTRGDLKKMVRSLLRQYKHEDLPDKHLQDYSLEDMLLRAYIRVCRELKPLIVSYTLAATASQAVYDLADFGVDGAGARIFEITYVAYDERELTRTSPAHLSNQNPRWRHAAAGAPRFYTPWGDGQIQLYPMPDGTENIYLEGFATPNPSTFADDSHKPILHVDDQPLIAVWAAMFYMTGSPSEHAMRLTALWPMWETDIAKAKARLYDQGTIIIGREQVGGSDGWPPFSDDITRL